MLLLILSPATIAKSLRLIFVLFWLFGYCRGTSRNPIFLFGPFSQIDKAASFRTERTIGITFPFRHLATGWAFNLFVHNKPNAHDNQKKIQILGAVGAGVWFRFLGQIIVYRLDHSAFFAKDEPAQGGKVVFLR